MNTRKIVITAAAAAVVFAVTWTVRIPIPGTSGGYVNLGDSVIYMAAFLFGGPAAAAAAAIGSALADVAAGSVVYAAGTFVIKALMGLVSGLLCKSKKLFAFMLACLTGGAIMTAGYALYESFVFGTAYAMASVPYNLLQWGGSVIVSAAVFPALHRIAKSLHTDGTISG